MTDPASGARAGGLFNGLDRADCRSLDDFLLNKARFKLPPTHDFVKWNNRMVSNLLYYQTNYFVVILVAFALVSALHPTEVFLGLFSVVLLVSAAVGAVSQHEDVARWRKAHPLALVLGSVVAIYVAVSLFSSVIVFLFGLLLPVLLCLIHSSVRLRSVGNKLSEQVEKLGFKRTLMGRLLELAGVDVAQVKWSFD